MKPTRKRLCRVGDVAIFNLDLKFPHHSRGRPCHTLILNLKFPHHSRGRLCSMSFIWMAAGYCFFTRILPLKDCNSIEDDPELEVPTRERPVEGTKVLWSFCWRGKSFSTVPVRERAVRSTEAFWGRVTSIAPLWVVRL